MHLKHYRSTALLLAFVLAAGMLGACGTQPTPTPTREEKGGTAPAPSAAPTQAPPTQTPIPPSPTPPPLKLSVWITDRIGMQAIAEVKTVVEAWGEENGVAVEITEGAQQEMMGRLLTAIPNGGGPDVFLNASSFTGQQAAAQLIAPLEDSLPAGDLAKYSEGAVKAFSLEGHLFGIPLAADVNALVYNTDLLPEPPQTMDELIAKSKELAAGGNYGLIYTIDQFQYSYPFFSGFGGYVFGWDGETWDVKDVGLDSPGAVAGLTYARDLVAVHNLMPADATVEVTNSMFMAGRAAMVLANPAAFQSFKAAGIHTGAARIPALPNGAYPHPLAAYTGISVSASSQHLKQAKALAVYLGKILPEPLYKANPANIPVYQPAIEALGPASDSELAGWLSQLEESDPLPGAAEMNAVWGPAAQAFYEVIHGTSQPEDALKAAQEAVLLANGLYP